MSIRKTAGAIAALGFLLAVSVRGVAEPGGTESVTLTLPQVEIMTQQALQENRPQLAYSLSEGLLQANPKNGRAHYYQAVALAGMRDFGKGRRSAARAYRLSQTDEQKYQSAQLAAKLSFADERLTISQLWLRRAVQYAPSDVTRDQSVLAYKKVRSRNPLNFNFFFSISPSDNVTNGSNSPFNLINGVPVGGSPTPVVSGVVSTAELRTTYRISESKTQETRLTSLFNARRVDLSDPIVGRSGSDLSSTTAQLGVRHTRAASGGAYWQFEGRGGRIWFGGDPFYNYLGLRAQRSHRLSANVKLAFGGDIEGQWGQTRRNIDTTVYKAFSSLNYDLASGSELGLYLQYRTADSDDVNRTSDQLSAIVSFSPKQQLGPARMTFSLGHSTLDYDDFYRLVPGIGSVPVPGGRNDSSTFGTVTATFNNWGYMGFVPTLSVRAEKSRSNMSLYDVDETSVSFGIRSEF